MSHVPIKNPGTQKTYNLPSDVLDLFQRKLQCVTAGVAKHGLRWEHKGIGTVFLENIGHDKCDVYVLPTSSEREWRNEKRLRQLLGEWGFPHLVGSVRQPRTRDLRVVQVEWGDLISLAPRLVAWIYAAEANEPFTPGPEPEDQEEIDAREDEIEASIKQDRTIDRTEIEAVVKARRGQGRYRKNLELIENACRVTKVIDKRLLNASHIKPWRLCDNNRERLDGNNGLLLCPSIDLLFDRGYISFEDGGRLLRSLCVSEKQLAAIGIPLEDSFNAGSFSEQQRSYLAFHRNIVFRE